MSTINTWYSRQTRGGHGKSYNKGHMCESEVKRVKMKSIAWMSSQVLELHEVLEGYARCFKVTSSA